MSQTSFYQQRTARFLTRSETALQNGDPETSNTFLLLAAENLYRAAEYAPPRIRNQLISQAEAITGLVETPEIHDTDHPGSEQPWQVIRNPGATIADVGGLTEAKKHIHDSVILPLANPEGARRWEKDVGGGILLYGPPGTGKTFFAKAVAGSLEMPFISVEGSSLLSKWVGDAEKNVAAVFQKVHEFENCVLFIDELEAFLPLRGSGSTVMDRVVPAFLSKMDGIGGRHKGLLLLGATNLPWAIDPAAMRPGRFSQSIYIGLPDQEARVDILRSLICNCPCDPCLDLRKLSNTLEGYSGADLKELCREAKLSAWKRELEEKETTFLNKSDFIAVKKYISPSTKTEDLKKYDNWKNRK